MTEPQLTDILLLPSSTQKIPERNTRKELPPSLINYVGITYPANERSQIRVAEKKANNWSYFDNGAFCSVNRLRMKICFSNEKGNCFNHPYLDYNEAPEILKDITSDIWTQEVITPLLKLIDEADLKQKELSNLLKSNPNVKTSACINFHLISYKERFGFTNYKDTAGVRTNQLAYRNSLWKYRFFLFVPYIVVMPFILFATFPLELILLLIRNFEKFICKTNRIDAGRQFLDNLFRDHPDLDFDSVEVNLAVGVQNIVENLNKVHLRNTPYEAVSWYGSKNVHHRKMNKNEPAYDREELKYLIVFQEKGANNL